jgi:murein DD-endopeptidase MepM/ murein hydrolase activator NlpD
VLVLVPTLPAAAAPSSDFEMPFPCGQAWTGTTRASHSPSSKAVDWNRADDVGDPVVAAAPGVVSVADSVANSGYGRWVTVDHIAGESTIYAHLTSVAVSAGQRVDQGTLLGYVGSTGNSTGPHLHFEERRDRTDIAPWFHGVKFKFGSTLTSQNCVDVPLAANMLGSAVAELVVFRRATAAKFFIRRATRAPKKVVFGTGTDEPVLGNWDGKGRANVGVFTPSTRTFTLQTPAGNVSTRYGRAGDKPVAGDWDGDGTWEIGVHRPSKAMFRLRRADGTTLAVRLGDADDLPVTGDWNGDRVTDIGVFDQDTASYTLRIVDPDGLVWTADVPFGVPGDLPVVGDWDGNAKTDLGTWDPLTATVSQRRAPSPSAAKRTVTTVVFGRPR